MVSELLLYGVPIDQALNDIYREEENWRLTLDEIKHQLEGLARSDYIDATAHVMAALAELTQKRQYLEILDRAIQENS